MNENIIINGLKDCLEKSVSGIIVNKASEPSEEYSIENSGGELFVSSLGINYEGDALPKVYAKNNYQFQIGIAAPTDETEELVLNITEEVRAAIRNIDLERFISGVAYGQFVFLNAQPVEARPGYQYRTTIFNIDIQEEA